MSEAVVEQFRSCTRKKKYSDSGSALSAAQTMKREGYGNLEAYRCVHCGGWHIGHPMKRIYEPDLEW